MSLNCEWCSYCCKERLDLIKHSFATHSVDPTFRFVCGIKRCLHVFTSGASFCSFKSHASRKHPHWQDHLVNDPGVVAEPTVSIPSSSPGPIGHDSFDESLPVDVDHEISHEMPAMSRTAPPSAQNVAALFLLTFQEKYKLPQKAINFAVGSVNTIVDSVCHSIQESVQECLAPISDGTDLAHCFDYEDPFSLLQTEYQQSKFYRERFGLIEPVTITLGTSYQYKQSGAKRRLVERCDTFQYIPFLENLEWFLDNKEIYKEVFKTRPQHSPEYLYDYCDGQVFKEHPLFCTYDQALQVIIYYDDVEVANPLGSYRGRHKLGNIEPKLRSALKCIQLIACITTQNLEKYGFEVILEPFIRDANKLSEGITMNLQGETREVRGSVLFALADTLAANSMGGFKIGVGFSLRKCRVCLATKEQLSEKFKTRDFILRTAETYDYHCLMLEGPLEKELSTSYGINFHSPLNSLAYFHVIGQLPQDIMHILFEGVVPYELLLMLTYFITNKKYFSTELLNDRIASFAYTTTEAKDKPSPVKHNVITKGGPLSQTSAQMWTLAISLPLMIGDKVPEDEQKWECFLLLLDIVQLCTSRVASSAQAGFMEALIHDHHQLFRRCYPTASVTPKMHFMVHFPQQILKTGPLLNTWCMRMEGKNSYIKQVAQSSNFKNVPYTVAKRHQRLMCSYLQSNSFFETHIECGPANEPKELNSESSVTVAKIMEICTCEITAILVYRPKWIMFMGTKYNFHDYILIGWEDDDLPRFGCIQDILFVDNEALFQVLEYKTLGIDRHYHSFCVKQSNVQSIYWLRELPDHHSFQSHRLSNHSLYITFRSHIENTSTM